MLPERTVDSAVPLKSEKTRMSPLLVFNDKGKVVSPPEIFEFNDDFMIDLIWDVLSEAASPRDADHTTPSERMLASDWLRTWIFPSWDRTSYEENSFLGIDPEVVLMLALR